MSQNKREQRAASTVVVAVAVAAFAALLGWRVWAPGAARGAPVDALAIETAAGAAVAADPGVAAAPARDPLPADLDEVVFHVRCAADGTPIEGAELCVARRAARVYTERNTESLGTTGPKGSCRVRVDALRSCGPEHVIVAAHPEYATGVAPFPAAGRADVTVRLPRASELVVVCSDENGAPVFGAVVAVSRRPIGSFLPAALRGIAAPYEHAICHASSDHTGTAVIRGLRVGDRELWLHAQHDRMVAVGGMEEVRIALPSPPLQLTFRALHAVVLDTRPAGLRAFHKRARPSQLDRARGLGVFAAAAKYRELTQRYAGMPVFVGLPRKNLVERGIPVRFSMVFENGRTAQCEVRSSPLVEGFEPQVLRVQPAGEAGSCVIDVYDQLGRALDVPITLSRPGGPALRIASGAATMLPVGEYEYSGDYGFPSLRRALGEHRIAIAAGAVATRTHDLQTPFVPCRVAVRYPYEDYETNLSLEVRDALGYAETLHNWSSQRNAGLLYLPPGDCELRASAAGLRSATARCVVPDRLGEIFEIPLVLREEHAQ